MYKQGAVGWWVAQASQHWVTWTCSQMCCWVSRTLKRCFKPVWSPGCPERLPPPKNQNTCLFFSQYNNFLSFHAWSTLKSFADVAEEVEVTCSARGTGSDCSAAHVLQEMGSHSPLHLLQTTLNFIYLFYTLPQPFLFQTEESSYRSSFTPQTI